jgi:outer membrane receptor protein involved in Fe transport
MFTKPTTCFLRILFLLPFFLAGIESVCFSQTLKGKVFDSQSGEPMAGATVHLEGTKYATIVNLDGSYILKNIKAGTYTMEVTLAGYKTVKHSEIRLTDNGVVNAADISLEIDAKELTKVIVSDAGKTTDHSVRNMEKNSDAVQNILSERTIQLLPDVTVANALQRISGVTIQRDNTGDGRYAIIRGMDQRYNTTLVNGVKIPSPDDKYRFVPMDIFPSEMLERLEVIKALTPNMEGDAIGGTMNLVMKSAPDRFLLSANVAAGYSTLFSTRPFTQFNHSGINKKSPAEIYGNSYVANPLTDFPVGNLNFTSKSNPINSTVGFTVGDRFLNKKLGVILSASYQNFYKGSISERLVPDAQPLPSPAANTLNPSDAYVRQYNTETNRIGLQNKIDYAINDKNKISLFNMYLHQNAFESRYTPDSVVGLNSSATQATVNPGYRSRWQIQNIYNATLHGDHALSGKVTLDWSGVYSIAKQQIPDMASYNFDLQVISSNGKVTQEDSTIPVGTANVMSRVWQHNTDQDVAGYANINYRPTIFNREIEFQAGGLYRYKTRDNYYASYDLQSSASSGTPFTSIAAVPLYFQTPGQATGNVTATTANTYTAHEKVASGYIQAKLMLTKSLQLLTGVRIENTQDDYNTALPLTSTVGAFGTIQYTDVLPGVHLKYLLTSNQNLRLSYFKSISRPGFGDIVPTTDPSDEQFTRLGNPYLKHVRADNFDFRYELFPGHADQLLLGAFYKQLQNPIEYFVTNLYGPSSLYIQPQNTSQATNFGFEAVFTKYLGMFGISANYTYTHSKITTTKLLYLFVQGVGNQTEYTSQSRPLQGQANHVGNVSLLYKNPKIGLELQLAFAYTGDRIAQVSPYYNLDIWQKPFSQLDFSLEKKITRRLSFYGKVNNITNAPSKEYIKFPYSSVNQNFSGGYSIPYQDAGSNYTVAQRDTYKLSFLGGLRFKF